MYFDKMKKDPKKMIKKIFSELFNLKKHFDLEDFVGISKKDIVFSELNLFSAVSSFIFVSFFIISAIIHIASPNEYWNHFLVLLFLFEMSFFFLVYSRKIWLADIKSSREWFEEIGFEILAIRYHVIKTNKWAGLEVLFGTVAFLIIFPYVFGLIFDDEELSVDDEQFLMTAYSFVFSFIWIPLILILSNLIFRLRFFFKYFSNYYCSKGCLLLIKNGDTLEDEYKARVFKFCLEFYDDFLKLSTNVRIKDLDIIYSNVLSQLKKPLDTFYEEFLKTFENEKPFEPLAYLASILNETESSKLITAYRFTNKFKIGAKWLIPSILAILAVLNFVFGTGKLLVDELIKYLSQFMPKISFG